jgi:hypothetical protein
VDFYQPYVMSPGGDSGSKPCGYHFDPAHAVPNKQFGAILLYDVLEHIPNYHYTLAHLTTTLRIGGRIFENTPFAKTAGAAETDVHLPASKPMKDVMAACGLVRENSWWRKVDDGSIPTEWLTQERPDGV